MRIGAIVRMTGIVVAVAVAGAAGSASAGKGTAWRTDRARYVEGDEVVISFTNRTDRSVQMQNPWKIERAGTQDTVAIYEWPAEELMIQPGETREWRWDQLDGGCYGICQPVQPGEQAIAGRYLAIATIGGKTYSDSFDLGAYFTVKFDNLDEEEFVVFAADQEDVDQMRAEAETEDKTLIVSGVVRRGKSYNPDWNFVMGSRSIELGEVFIEVCDGSPHYVQRHRSDWLGERWCPWSSYVEREGR